MFEKLEELLCTCGGEERTKEDIAASFVTVLMARMVQVACDNAEGAGTKYVGLTGGVSYNIPIVKMVKELVKTRNKELLLHYNVPNGDGGISIGHNIHIGERLRHEKK
jgi:hydrogenase maturation protein HypF